MVDRARIFWAEDSVDYRETAVELLAQAGHTVVRTANTLDESKKAVPHLEEDGIQIAIIDGNLTPGGSGKDGPAIISYINYLHPKIVTIGNSTLDRVDGADFQSPKRFGARGLLEAIVKATYPANRPPRL